MSALLTVENLESGYGEFKVLHGISFEVGEAENIGFFGPNGHGKTTLFDTITGLIRPTAGRVAFDGVDITRADTSDIVELGLIHVSQGNTLFPQMSVLEVLRMAAFTARARRTASQTLDRALTMFPRLRERETSLCRMLSGGERQMLNIAVGLMGAPRLLILDEPTLGLSPLLKSELASSIADIAKSGVPLIVVEQDIEFLLSLSDRLFLVNHGEITREINQADDTLDHADIMAEYFGVGDGDDL